MAGVTQPLFGGVLSGLANYGKRARNAWGTNPMWSNAARRMGVNAAAGGLIGGTVGGAYSSAQGRGFMRGAKRGAMIGAMAGGVYGAAGTGIKSNLYGKYNRYANRGRATATSNRGMPSWYGANAPSKYPRNSAVALRQSIAERAMQ